MSENLSLNYILSVFLLRIVVWHMPCRLPIPAILNGSSKELTVIMTLLRYR